MIRIASGQGKAADWIDQPDRLVLQTPIDFLLLDFLSDNALIEFQQQKNVASELGYFENFTRFLEKAAKDLKKRGIRIITNAGGVNPLECARQVRKVSPHLKIAAIDGSAIYEYILSLIEKGQTFRNIDSGNDISTIKSRILTANVNLGAFPVAEALNTEADVIIAGHCLIPSMITGAMIHIFGTGSSDWDTLASGTIAGHLIQSKSRCLQPLSEASPRQTCPGIPIIEMDSDGSFTVTRQSESCRPLDQHTVKEQLLNQINDPSRYFTPDVVADLTSISVQDDGECRVRITGAKGQPRPEKLKVSIQYLKESGIPSEWLTLIPREEILPRIEVIH